MPSDESSCREHSHRDLVEYLDFEITRIREDTKRFGWTHWAFIGATAAAVWTALGFLPPAGMSGERLFMVFLAAIFLVDSIMGFLSGLSRLPAAASPAHKRYALTNRMFWDSKLVFLWAITRSVIVLVWIGRYIDTVPTAIAWPARIYLGVVGSVAALGFLITLFTIPLSTTSPHSSLVVRSLFSVIGLASPWVAVMSIIAIVDSHALYTTQEFRFGALLAGIVYLLLILTWGLKDHGLLAILVQLRRDVSLGQIDPGQAKHQAILAIKGMDAMDVIRIPVNEVLTHLREATNHQAAAARLADAIVDEQGVGYSERAASGSNNNESRQLIGERLRAARSAIHASRAPLRRLNYFARIIPILDADATMTLRNLEREVLDEVSEIEQLLDVLQTKIAKVVSGSSSPSGALKE